MYSKFAKGTIFGGKYGTKININYSKINSLDGGPSFLNDNNEYSSSMNINNSTINYKDLNLTINKKINKK